MKERNIEQKRNVVIIGSGPAGYTAAIYTARALLKPILVTDHIAGGQLMTTTDVENFPAFPEGIQGPELMMKMEAQAHRFGTHIVNDRVTKIEPEGELYRVFLDSDYTILTKTVIIATGAQALWLNLDGEDKLRGRGLSTCATCDGAFFRNKEVIVIGGGDSAMEEAIFLTRFASKVTIIHRRNEFRASKIMLERAKKNSKIEWKTNTTVKEWIPDSHGNLCGAILNTSQGKEKIQCDGAFIAIGHRPNTEFLNNLLKLDNDEYILTQGNTTHTNRKGIFAAGDVVDKRYRQAITAAADGCKAAIDCEKYLEEN